MRIRDLSITRKLVLITMLTSSVALILAGAAFLTYDVLTFRKMVSTDLLSVAEVTGFNSRAALAFNDPKAAEGTLSALTLRLHVVAACIYTPDGKVFAKYVRAGAKAPIPDRPEPAGATFVGDHLQVFKPILLEKEPVGTIYCLRDMQDMNDRLVLYSLMALAVLFISSLAAFGISAVLQRVISVPILQLAQTTKTVSEQKDYSLRATKRSSDELGVLTDGFNEMLAQIQTRDTALRESQNALKKAHDELERRVEERTRELQEAHAQLLETAHRAGMAEIATSILHNVGNVLTGVNASASLIGETMRGSRVTVLPKVVEMIEQHKGNLASFLTTDEKGMQLPGYIAVVSEHLMKEREGILDEIDALNRNVEHIRNIVNMQQSYAGVASMVELTALPQLIEDAVRINSAGLGRHGIEIRREIDAIEPIPIEKHRVLQILVNLLSNAKYALAGTSHERRVIVRLRKLDTGFIEIQVCDNGAGIATDDLTRIFRYGFTTRKDGHGFGLHSSAMAAQAMSGSLTASSDGPGKGSIFTLLLPRECNGEASRNQP